MVKKIDTALVKKLSTPEKGNRITYDTEVKGFGLRVTAAGGRSFVLNFRNRHGRERRYTIGDFPSWSVKAARERAGELKQYIKRGGDPLQDEQDGRDAATVSELCDRYLAEHVEIHNKESSEREFRRLVESAIRPKLGHLKVEEVEPRHVADLHRQMGNTKRSANQVLSVLSKMFNLAEHPWSLRAQNTNPVKGIQRYPEKERERFFSDEELARIGKVLAELQKEGAINSDVANIIQLLALTGCRIGEILTAKWEYVDFEGGIPKLPDAKAGSRPVPLGAPALVLLDGLNRTREYLFEFKPGEPYEYWRIGRPWANLIRERAELGDARLHDLRHTVGTVAGTRSGLTTFLVRDLLGHKTLVMASKYVSRNIDPLRAAADDVSRRIAAAMNGESAEVTQFREDNAS